MATLVVFVAMFCCTFRAMSAEKEDSIKVEKRSIGKTILLGVDRFLELKPVDFVLGIAAYDSAYIINMEKGWSVRTNYKMSGNLVGLEWEDGDTQYDAMMKTKSQSLVQFGFAYKTLSFTIGIDPNEFSGRLKDCFKFGVDIQGSKFGFGYTYSSMNFKEGSLKWKNEVENGEIEINSDRLFQESVEISGSYVINYKKYSRPAALSQKQIQRESAGSLIVSATYFDGLIGGKVENKAVDINKDKISFGIGYARNIVLPRGWLLSIYAIPEFPIYTYYVTRDIDLSTYDVNKRRIKQNFFQDIVFTGRMGVVRNVGRNSFFGTSFYYKVDTSGNHKDLALSTTHQYIDIFFGVRF